MQAGHRIKAIESLELTITADPKLIQRFKTFNSKRNKSSYDVAGSISNQDLDAMRKFAADLTDTLYRWLKQFHANLLKG